SGKPRGFEAYGENVSADLELSAATDRGGQRGCTCRRMRNCDVVRFHSGSSGGQVRLHRGEDRIPARDCFRLSHAADRGKEGARPFANRKNARSGRSERAWIGERNRSRGKPARALQRACRNADRSESWESLSRKTLDDFVCGAER